MKHLHREQLSQCLSWSSRPYPGIAPVANATTILTLTLTLIRGLILDNAIFSLQSAAYNNW